MLAYSTSLSWSLILKRSLKTSLKSVPAYIRIEPSQLFTKRELHLAVLACIDHEDIASFASDFNAGFMPYGARYTMDYYMLC